MREYDHEPVRGLPEKLPAGEWILWQGSPSAQRLASTVFHWRVIAIYFAALMFWRVIATLSDGGTTTDAALAAAILAAPALVTFALIAIAAAAYARSSVYTITNRRLVMRIGVALPKAINIPFTIVRSADLRTYANGDGDIPLSLKGADRIAYMQLWPHARPCTFNPAQPMLRAVPNAPAVAATLAGALRGETTEPAPIETVRDERDGPAAQPAPAAA